MSGKRKAISKKTRFEVFKRDGFRCVYCGATPLAELLHVDHVIAVAQGGDSDMDNYCTSCVPCNLGKGARSLADIPQSLADKAKNIAEQEAQIVGYQTIIAGRRQRLEDETWQVVQLLEPGCESFNRKDFQSIKMFIEKIGLDETIESMESSQLRGFGKPSTLRYFYAICWRKVRELQNA